MMGKNHKAIGVACAVAISSYGLATGQPLYLVSLATCPAGAMLPDIDHDNSALGKQRTKYTGYLESAATWLIGFAVGCIVTDGFHTDSVFKAILLLTVLFSLGIGIAFIKKTSMKNKYLNFFVKHRGIMHTMVIPVLMLCMSFMTTTDIFRIILQTLSYGYISHLLSDCVTVAGCPILYPLSMGNFGLKLVRTNTIKETIATIVIIGGILCLAISFWVI